MGRPLRLEMKGCWYHVTGRGNERKSIFRDDVDRRFFLSLLARLDERFGVRVGSYVLMSNHYHLLVWLLDRNLSRAIQWLQVNYAISFNRRHRRQGHLFQARYGAVAVEDGAGVAEVSRYIHLNPVRLARFGLGKMEQHRQRHGLGEKPSPEQIKQWIKALHSYQWSSYLGFLHEAQPWVIEEEVLSRLGLEPSVEGKRHYCAYTEEGLRRGVAETFWDRVEAGSLYGSRRFIEKMIPLIRGDRKEQKAVRQLRPKSDWKAIVAAVEAVKEEKWEEFQNRQGDEGRGLAMTAARERGRLSLKEIGEKVGLSYNAVSMAVRRFQDRMKSDLAVRNQYEKIVGEIGDAQT